MKQGARELSAEKISMELDSTFHAQHLIAEGHPVVKSAENGATLNVSAEKFEGFLSPSGWMQRIVAAGNVNGSRAAKIGTDHFTAAQVEIAMQPERNLVREMTVKGDVIMDSRQDGASRSLKTEALLVKFGAGAQPDQQKIESAETLAPATIETKTADETTQLRARKFVTQFGPTGRLEKLIGHSAVEVRREIGKGAPQTSSSEALAATFGANGEWETLDQSGNVRFQQGDKRASAQQAKIVRTTDLIALNGSPVVSDATSRTSAGSVTINQKSGAITAADNVVSTYLVVHTIRRRESRRRTSAHFCGRARGFDDFRTCVLHRSSKTVAGRVGAECEPDRSVARRQKARGNRQRDRRVSAERFEPDRRRIWDGHRQAGRQVSGGHFRLAAKSSLIEGEPDRVGDPRAIAHLLG